MSMSRRTRWRVAGVVAAAAAVVGMGTVAAQAGGVNDGLAAGFSHTDTNGVGPDAQVGLPADAPVEVFGPGEQPGPMMSEEDFKKLMESKGAELVDEKQVGTR